MDEKAESWREWIGKEVYDKKWDFRGELKIDEDSRVYIQNNQLEAYFCGSDFFDKNYDIDADGIITWREG